MLILRAPAKWGPEGPPAKYSFVAYFLAEAVAMIKKATGPYVHINIFYVHNKNSLCT